jgi:hypothetical protein
MNHETPNNLNDLLNQAAKALDSGDVAWLEDLRLIAEGWLQDDESKNVQLYLLRSMAGAAEEIIDLQACLANED